MKKIKIISIIYTLLTISVITGCLVIGSLLMNNKVDRTNILSSLEIWLACTCGATGLIAIWLMVYDIYFNNP